MFKPCYLLFFVMFVIYFYALFIILDLVHYLSFNLLVIHFHILFVSYIFPCLWFCYIFSVI